MRWLVALHPLLCASVSAPPPKPAGGLPMLESQMSCGLCNAEQTGIRAPKLVCQFASPWVGGWDVHIALLVLAKGLSFGPLASSFTPQTLHKSPVAWLPSCSSPFILPSVSNIDRIFHSLLAE